MVPRSRTILTAAGLLIFGATGCFSQTAQITGRITDPTQAVVPQAQVLVTNSDTGITRSSPSNESGYYSIPLLPRGNYLVVVKKTGFKQVERTGIALDEGQVLRQDFVLEIGQVTETVEVSATPTQLETATTSMSTVVGSQRILDLPILSRNPVALAKLVPGVRAIGDFGGLPVSSYGTAGASIGGGSPSTNAYMIDGIAAENFTSGGMNVFLSVDATEEFRIITRNPSAEFGRTGGGVITVVSKSGTNEVHGSGYEFLRNKELNANGFFANSLGRARAPFIFNEYGATVGGPLKKNRTFFFFNWEHFKQRTQSQTRRTVPSDSQRRGDFSHTYDAAGELIRIYDPLTTRDDPFRPGRRTRDLFPGNIIPADRLHPVAKAVMTYYPAPNTPGLPVTGAENFFGQASAPIDKNMLGIKIDHNFTPERRLSGRFTYDRTFSGLPNFYASVAETNSSDLTLQRRSAALNYTDAIRPNVLLEAKAGVNRYAPFRPTRSYGFDVASLGLPASLRPQLQLPVFPEFNPGDVSGIGANQSDHLIQANDAWTLGGALTWFRGKHVIKTGWEGRIYRLNNTQGNPVLTFSFGRGFTQGPDPIVPSKAAGYGFAGFLLGLPSTGQAGRWPTSTFQAKYTSAFIQDDWKIHPNLTLNLGLRWEYEGAVTDRFNAITNFDPDLPFKAGPFSLRGGTVFPGVSGIPRGMHDNSYKDFGPRFGFAYQVLPKTSLRGGFGLYFLPGTGVFVAPGRTGFAITNSMVTSVEVGVPYNTLTNPFPSGIQLPTGSSLGPLTGLGLDVTANVRSLRRGYSEQWNLNIQRDLPAGWLLEVGYLGNHGVKLPASRAYSYLSPETRALGNAALDQVPNPFYGTITTGVLSLPTVRRHFLLNQYPQFASILGLDTWANSNYHALAVRAERRFSRGFSAMLAYTYSKLIDDNLGNGTLPQDFSGGGANSIQDYSNLRAERAVSTSHLPHRMVLTPSWSLPLGRKGGSLYRALLGGWQVNSILTMQSGNPLSISGPAGALAGSRPNVVGDPNLDNPTIQRWFNTDAFQVIPPFSIGNAPRNLPSTRTDRLFNWDFSVLKRVSIREWARLELRGEFFNFTNSVTFGTPGTFLTGATFGVVSSQANGPRNIQAGAKVSF